MHALICSAAAAATNPKSLTHGERAKFAEPQDYSSLMRLLSYGMGDHLCQAALKEDEAPYASDSKAFAVSVEKLRRPVREYYAWGWHGKELLRHRVHSFHPSLSPLALGEMVYVAVAVDIPLSALPHTSLLKQVTLPVHDDDDKCWHFFSIQSLTVNAACRSALIHAIFFSEAHMHLRECLVGKFTLQKNMLLCPNGPNVKPTSVGFDGPTSIEMDSEHEAYRTTMLIPSFSGHDSHVEHEKAVVLQPEKFAFDLTRPHRNTHGSHTATLMAAHEHLINTMPYERVKNLASGSSGSPYAHGTRFDVVANQVPEMKVLLCGLGRRATQTPYSSER